MVIIITIAIIIITIIVIVIIISYLHDKVWVGKSLALVADSIVDQPESEVEPDGEHYRAPVDHRPRLRLYSKLRKFGFKG